MEVEVPVFGQNGSERAIFSANLDPVPLLLPARGRKGIRIPSRRGLFVRFFSRKKCARATKSEQTKQIGRTGAARPPEAGDYVVVEVESAGVSTLVCSAVERTTAVAWYEEGGGHVNAVV